MKLLRLLSLVALSAAALRAAPVESRITAVTVYTDRSSNFALRQSARTATGAIITGEALALGIVVPRNGSVGFKQANNPLKPALSESDTEITAERP